ncbi:DNA polymerase-4 [Sediminihabitans luteus]|uniref:DNA polymerase IV n=1 Tax=Sediminihabitans luteus TaxID=1138585 RepID=A0A2M9CQF8_9CELL|nr:DNA polymerase IV [Sediminihabitans luteus]PJJ74129.1 DNA polymerase-4 [Sediminihabitans luteus]
MDRPDREHELLADAARVRARATVLHADADSFFAAVEQRDKPSLRGKGVLVGGTGPRGVVSTASYEARRLGAHSAMAMARARRLAPAAAVLFPRFAAYSAYSRVIMAELARLSDLVEPLSIDEAFVDLEHSPGGDDPTAAAQGARARIRERTGLAVSIGVGRTKLVAKIASDAAKPDGLLVVEPDDEDAFLLPLPVRAIPGVGPATAAALDRLDVRTVADLRRRALDMLTMTLGESSGTNLYRLARNIDLRPVAVSGERKSVGAERTFAADIYGREAVRTAIDAVADEALQRLVRHGGGARTVVAKVRFADFTTITRSVTLPQPTADEPALRDAAQQAALAAGIDDSVRLLGVSFHNLSPHAQLTLDWDVDETTEPVTDATASDPGAPEAHAPDPHESVEHESVENESVEHESVEHESVAHAHDEPAPDAVRGSIGSDGAPLTEANARPGLDVEHARLGRGWVVHVRGRAATVRFETSHTAPATSRVLDLDTDPLVLVPPLAVAELALGLGPTTDDVAHDDPATGETGTDDLGTEETE